MINYYYLLIIDRLKEELIQELVKNNKSIKSLNDAYQRKISSLETEAGCLKKKIKKVKIEKIHNLILFEFRLVLEAAVD